MATELNFYHQIVSNVIKQNQGNLNIDKKSGSIRKKGPHEKKVHWEGQKIESILKITPNTSGGKAARLAQCFDYLVRKFKANAELKTYKV